MRRLILYCMMVGGVVLLVVGLLLVPTPPGLVTAQDYTDAEYIGRGECNDCHRDVDRAHRSSPHVLALQDVADEEAKVSILGDFSLGDAVRTVLFPGESEARPFTANDIVFAIGSGRYVQRYLIAAGDDAYTVLPAEWNTVTQAWEPFQLAETWPDPAYDFVSNCAGCHTTGLNASRGRWEDDGVECEACHGPGSTHADLVDDAGSSIDDEELVDIRGAIAFTSDSQVCGQCHSRGTTPDGSPYPTDYLPGQNLLDESVFTLVAGDDPVHWWVSGHASQPNMQFNEWTLSTHSTALEDMKASENAQDGCLVCHSDDLRRTNLLLELFNNGDLESDGEIPPEVATLETAQSGVSCTACHAPHSEDARDFLLRDDAETLCAACHSNEAFAALTGGGVHHPVADMFVGLPLVPGVEGVAAKHATADDGPSCATCHLAQVPVAGGTSRANHLFRPVLPDATDGQFASTCATCHTDLTEADLQFLVDDTQETVRNRIAVTLARLASVKEPEVGTPERELYDLAVNVLNVVQAEGSLGIHNYSYTDTLFKAAETALGELSVSAVVVAPTEAPAPTAIPPVDESALEGTPQVVPSGVRPITVIIIGLVVVSLLIAAFAFFRRPRSSQEA